MSSASTRELNPNQLLRPISEASQVPPARGKTRKVTAEEYIKRLLELVRVSEELTGIWGGESRQAELKLILDTIDILFPSHHFQASLEYMLDNLGHANLHFNLGKIVVNKIVLFGQMAARYRAIHVTLGYYENTYNRLGLSKQVNFFSTECTLLFVGKPTEHLRHADLHWYSETICQHLYEQAAEVLFQSESQEPVNLALEGLRTQLVRTQLAEKDVKEFDIFFDHHQDQQAAVKKFDDFFLDTPQEFMTRGSWKEVRGNERYNEDQWLLLWQTGFLADKIQETEYDHIKRDGSDVESGGENETGPLIAITHKDWKHLKISKSLARHRTFSRHSNPLLDNFSLRTQRRMLAAYQKAGALGY